MLVNDVAEDIGKRTLKLTNYDVHASVTAISQALVAMLATMVRTSTTPGASADPALAAIEAQIREGLIGIGVKCSPPALTLKEQMDQTGSVQ